MKPDSTTPPLQAPRRHPLCPYCGYDLVATVAANKRICPECGQGFDLSELHFDSVPGDWTLQKALATAAHVIFVRAVLATLVWAIAASMTVLLIALTNMPGLVPLIMGALAGYLMGRIYSEDLAERAGFSSLALVAGCMLAAIGSVLLAQVLIELLLPYRSSWSRMILIGAGMVVCWTKIISTYALDSA